MSIEDDIKVEENSVQAIQYLCWLIAKHSHPIAHWGDGNCGAIFDYLEQALIQEGLLNRNHDEYIKKETVREPISNHTRKIVFERDAYRCRICGDYHNLHIDHVKPVSKGGTNDLSNLQTLCQTCNLKKGNRHE